MQQHPAHRPKSSKPAGIVALPLSQFSSGKIMVGCECTERSFVDVRSLLPLKGEAITVGEAINKYRCARCGQPAASACLLSQVKII